MNWKHPMDTSLPYISPQYRTPGGSTHVHREYIPIVLSLSISLRRTRWTKGTKAGLIYYDEPTILPGATFMYGTSPANIRIESWWAQLSKRQTNRWRVCLLIRIWLYNHCFNLPARHTTRSRTPEMDIIKYSIYHLFGKISLIVQMHGIIWRQTKRPSVAHGWCTPTQELWYYIITFQLYWHCYTSLNRSKLLPLSYIIIGTLHLGLKSIKQLISYYVMLSIFIMLAEMPMRTLHPLPNPVGALS